MEDKGQCWRGGGKNWFFRTAPAPPFCTTSLEHLNWRKVLYKNEGRLKNVHEYEALFSDTCFVWLHNWDKESMSGLFYHLSDHVVRYFLHGLLILQKKKKKRFSLRCRGTATPATSIFVDYLYLYCIGKVQSLLLHHHRFELHPSHWDKLWDMQAYDQDNLFLGCSSVLRPPHLSSCRRPTAVWCFPRREEISTVTWVCQDATS